MKHILILFTDQQRWDMIGALGNDHIQTPNLDALVRDSITFNRCTTPSPVCVPARLSMFSGQYPAHTGCNNNNVENVYDGEGFYAELTKAGYQSCAVGKMHYLKDPYGPMGFEKRWTQEELAEPEDDYTKFIMGNYPWIIDYNAIGKRAMVDPSSRIPFIIHPSDRNQSTTSKTYEMYTKTHPHYPGRMDHTMRHDEEAAMIPAGYRIDLA